VVTSNTPPSYLSQYFSPLPPQYGTTSTYHYTNISSDCHITKQWSLPPQSFHSMDWTVIWRCAVSIALQSAVSEHVYSSFFLYQRRFYLFFFVFFFPRLSPPFPYSQPLAISFIGRPIRHCGPHYFIRITDTVSYFLTVPVYSSTLCFFPSPVRSLPSSFLGAFHVCPVSPFRTKCFAFPEVEASSSFTPLFRALPSFPLLKVRGELRD